jgi:hypothetical protein
MIIDCTNNPSQPTMEASPELKFFAHIQKWLRKQTIGRHAIIAGSYALHAFMCSSGQSEYTNQHCFVPNDIDIYVNVQMPTLIMLITGFIVMHTEYALLNFEIKKGYSNNSVRIDAIVDFRLLSADQCIKVQVIAWNQDATFYSAYDLGHAVISAFDISVCRVAITNSKDFNKYYFCDYDDAHDIYLHRFKLKMKPRDNTRIVFNRILKYTSRGFCLYQLLFQDGIIAGAFTVTEIFHEEE